MSRGSFWICGWWRAGNGREMGCWFVGGLEVWEMRERESFGAEDVPDGVGT